MILEGLLKMKESMIWCDAQNSQRNKNPVKRKIRKHSLITLVQKVSAGIFITRKKIRRILQAARDDFCILQENHGIKKKK